MVDKTLKQDGVLLKTENNKQHCNHWYILNKIALPGFVSFLLRQFHLQVYNKKKKGKQILLLEI